jgi:hypothetical protein
MAHPDARSARERLRQRRAQLVHRSTVLRERLARHTEGLQPLFGLADQLRAGWRWVRAHPGVLLLAAGWLLWRRPRWLFSALLLAWRGWRWWQRLAPTWIGRATGVAPSPWRGG